MQVLARFLLALGVAPLVLLLTLIVRPHLGQHAALQILQPLLFLALTAIAFTRHGAALPTDWPARSARQIALAAVPLAWAFSIVPMHSEQDIWTASFLITAAATEEIIFRVLLPRECRAILSVRFSKASSSAAALLAPQLVFAAAHWITTSIAGGPQLALVDILRLTGSGLLLQTLQLVFGVGAGIGVHASMNILIVLDPHHLSASPTLFTVIPTVLAAGLLLVGLSNAQSQRAAITQPREGGQHEGAASDSGGIRGGDSSWAFRVLGW